MNRSIHLTKPAIATVKDNYLYPQTMNVFKCGTISGHKTMGVAILPPAELVDLISDALGGGGLWGLALMLLVVEGVALGGGGTAGLGRSALAGKVWLRLRKPVFVVLECSARKNKRRERREEEKEAIILYL